MTYPKLQLLIWTGATMLCCSSAQAGEQVQIRGATSIEIPKPKRSFGESRRINSDGEKPNLEGGFVAPPSAENSPLADKKMREALDKKKNWIFMNPYEQRFDSKTEEFLGAEKNTSLYNNHWMEGEEEKGAVQKFMEEKDPRSKRGEKEDNEDKPDRSEARDSGKNGSPNDEKDPIKEESPFLGNRVITDTPSLRGSLGSPFESSFLDKGPERISLGENPFAAKKPAVSAVEREEIAQRQVAHEEEFNQILQTRLGSAAAIRPDPLNLTADATRLEVNPIAPRRSEQFLNLGRPAPPATVTFNDGGASAGRSVNFDRGNFAEVAGPKSIGQSPFAAPAPAVAPRASSFTPSAFSLPFPQRKF
ncbi:MAG TPA: hypothetical protein VK633_06650 [Verrucomicrobiae bacterium]|nr:hypothetical protein [Verrucomicrobiae bacterium]